MRMLLDQSTLRARVAERLSCESGSASTLTRRHILTGGLASAALVYIGKVSGDGRLSIATGSDWLSLRVDDIEKFRLDAGRFHGRPRFWKEIGNKTIVFGVRGARVPGTLLSADLI